MVFQEQFCVVQSNTFIALYLGLIDLDPDISYLCVIEVLYYREYKLYNNNLGCMAMVCINDISVIKMGIIKVFYGTSQTYMRIEVINMCDGLQNRLIKLIEKIKTSITYLI